MKLKKDRISKPNEILTVTYKKGYKPKPLQPIDEGMIEGRSFKMVYSYHGTSRLFYILCTSEGKKTYAVNSKISEKTPTHEALEVLFNI